MGLDIKWYVPLGDSAVFDITKRKFHNVLQGVAPPDTCLHDHEKELFERWTAWNYDKYWKGDSKGENGVTDGPSPIEADVVVIDDPQRKCISVAWLWFNPFTYSHRVDSDHPA
jgi:hypothetical protein